MLFRPTRRELLLAGVAGAGALAVGFYGGFKFGRRDERQRRIVPPREQPFAPNAFIAIDERGDVTIWLPQSEIGQGVATSLPLSLADELGADPARVQLRLAPANECYGGQFTAVSSSVRSNWLALRRAGAAAREMLVAAAAAGFGVDPAACEARSGEVVHAASGRRLPFHALVAAAARLPVPAEPRLKPASAFTLIGKTMPRLDHRAKVNGSARFGIDVRMPGMAFAVVARCPVHGGRIASFDGAAAMRVEGVRDVFAIESGVAVLADTSYAAMRGREALVLTFDRGDNVRWSSDNLWQHIAELASQPGAIARQAGRGSAGLVGDGRRIAVEYRLPFLAHATMEPMNCTADVRADGCTIEVPTQVPQSVRDEAARRLGLAPEKVLVQPTFVGGAFGRRVAMDFVIEALLCSQHARRPVQVLWTREDDFAHDHFRPCSLHRLEARLGADGLPLAWQHRIVTPSIAAQDPGFRDPIDAVAVEGAQELPYGIADLQVELVKAPAPCRLGFWRSVGHSFNAFAVECFVDEIARAAGIDPVEMRRRLLVGPDTTRHRAVLELAVAQAGAAPTGVGKGRGFALHASYGSHVAMVADVHVAGERLQVERVTAAVDCGYPVHPDGVKAQIEGGVAFALAAALHGCITFREGAVVESNFHDHPLLRCSAMPEVAVHLVHPEVPPAELGGVGEIAVPPLAPAVANAIAEATGVRHRELPLPFG
jgi:isoquinoline 1-oxidoreductase subunit beta